MWTGGLKGLEVVVPLAIEVGDLSQDVTSHVHRDIVVVVVAVEVTRLHMGQ